MFWLIGLLIGGNVFFAVLLFFMYRDCRAYHTCERQLAKMKVNCEAYKDAYERLRRRTDLIEAQRQEKMVMGQEIENLTQYPN